MTTTSKKPIVVGRFEMQVSLPNEAGISTHYVAPGSIWIEDYATAYRMAERINKRMGRE